MEEVVKQPLSSRIDDKMNDLNNRVKAMRQIADARTELPAETDVDPLIPALDMLDEARAVFRPAVIHVIPALYELGRTHRGLFRLLTGRHITVRQYLRLSTSVDATKELLAQRLVELGFAELAPRAGIKQFKPQGSYAPNQFDGSTLRMIAEKMRAHEGPTTDAASNGDEDTFAAAFSSASNND